MIKLLRHRWWKLLSIPLLFYAIVAGLLTPLAPGISTITPEVVERGKVVNISVVGYNSSFSEQYPNVVLLKNENNILCASNVEVISEREINVEFNLPNTLFVEGNRDRYNVVVRNENDGTFFRRGGISIEKKDDNEGLKMECTIQVPITAPTRTTFPYREILYESIRNLYYHVPMWFTMIFVMLFSFGSSIAYLSSGNMRHDIFASQSAKVGVFFGVLGILTGMQWANMTWGAPWVNDPKLNGAAVGILVYLAYFVLRGSLDNEQTRAKVAAVYGIFSYVIFIVFIFVIPRMTDTLHPGSGGNPAFTTYDLDNKMRPVFYAGAMGFIIVGMWITSLSIRLTLIKRKLEFENY